MGGVVCACACKCPWRPEALELQEVGSHLRSVLGIELRSSEQPMLITAEPSLQLDTFVFKESTFCGLFTLKSRCT